MSITKMEESAFRATAPAKRVPGRSRQQRRQGRQLQQFLWASIHNPWARIFSCSLQGATISIRCQAHQAVATVIVTMMAMAMEDMVIVMMVAMVIAMMMAMVTVMQANTGDMGVRHRKMFALSFWIL